MIRFKNVIVMAIIMLSCSSLQAKLQITYPNGSEKILTGSEVEITWEGVAAEDTVRLEYSMDAGLTWNLITENATGLKYLWKEIPDTMSRRCLMKVSKGSVDKPITLNAGGNWNSTVEFSPNSEILAYSSDNFVKLLNIETWKNLSEIQFDYKVTAVCFAPNGNDLAFGFEDGAIEILNIETMLRTVVLEGQYYMPVTSLSFRPDGRFLAGSRLNEVYIWDTENWELTYNIPIGGYLAYSIVFSPDTNLLAVKTTNLIRVYNVEDMTEEFSETQYCLFRSKCTRSFAQSVPPFFNL